MSPFMSGLIVGMTIFSALTLQWAKADLVRWQQRQQEQGLADAQELSRSLEFAVMTEGADSYEESYSLDRARQFSSASSKTMGGNDVQLTERQAAETDPFGNRRTQVAITASDDILLRAQVNRAGSTEELNRMVSGTNPVALFDSTTVRGKQVLTSKKRMEAMAEQVFTFYAGAMQFPTDDEFMTLSGKAGVKDAWGRAFDYELGADGQSAELSFTTPWGVTHKQPISLRDEEKSAE